MLDGEDGSGYRRFDRDVLGGESCRSGSYLVIVGSEVGFGFGCG